MHKTYTCSNSSRLVHLSIFAVQFSDFFLLFYFHYQDFNVDLVLQYSLGFVLNNKNNHDITIIIIKKAMQFVFVYFYIC